MNKHINTKEYPLETVLDLFRALNDPVRQKIILLFRENGEFNAGDIARNFRVSRPTISHHLNLLRRAKVLGSRKEGKEIFYSFNKDYVIDVLERIIKFLHGCC